MYCDMTRTCGGIKGGWTLVAKLDMTNRNNSCPEGLTQRPDYPKRTCTSTLKGPGCSNTSISTYGISYRQVCGRVTGYQYGTPDAFYPSLVGGQTLKSYYVEPYTHGSMATMLMVSALHTAVLHTLNTYGLLQSQMIRWCHTCLLYTSPSPRDATLSRMPSSA